MNADELLRHFERVADAPEAIARLRRFVLNLAVRGRLVQQEAGDESALSLQRRIEQAKHELIRAGELRRPRDRDTGIELDKPFGLPLSWAWVRLDAVGAIVGGGTPPAGEARNFAEPGQGIPWLTPADLGGRKGLYVSRGARDLSEEGLRSSSATVMPAGSVLFTSRAPIGYVAIASNPVATNQGFKSVVPYLMECSRFVALVLQAFAPDIDAKAPGTTFKEVSGKIVAGVPFPLPPLAEQYRIVAKVDELMALCDRLEAAQASVEASRLELVTGCLGRVNAPSRETFAADAEFFVDQINHVIQSPQGIVRLRRTVLNLAVRGKLADQREGLDSTLSLLQRIGGSRPMLAGKRSVNQPAVEVHDVPDSWCWTTLGEIIVSGPQNGLSPRPTTRADAPKAITLTATTSGQFDPRFFKRVEADVPPGSELWLRDGDLLFQRGNTREYVGIAAVYRGPQNTFLYPDLMIRVRISPELSLPYVHLATLSPTARDFMARNATGAQLTMPKINQATLLALPIPVPPREEQDRIVATVEQLTTLCDQLERSMGDVDLGRSRLLDSLLRNALRSDEPMEMAT
jgi:type I restriction enzyme S subunit